MRVSKQNPCPICKKPNWCLLFKDAAICMRVTSPRSYTFKRSGETGYFHDLGVCEYAKKNLHTCIPHEPDPVINVGKLIQKWKEKTVQDWLDRLAHELDVAALSLRELGCVWAAEHRAWAFPMFDGYGNYVGIRLRAESGAKWSVKGSHAGIFIPNSPQTSGRTVFICEGPTDTAAALTLGYLAIGRPSCCGGLPDVQAAIAHLRVRRAVIVADNDEKYRKHGDRWEPYCPGLEGATVLAAHLRVPSCILALPAKDLREFLANGGTRELIDSMIEHEVWTQK